MNSTFRCSFARWFGVAMLLILAPMVFAQDPNPPSIKSGQGAWPIRRQWTPGETQHFAKWMEHIYIAKTKGDTEQRIAKLDKILTDPKINLLLDPTFAGAGSNPQLGRGTISFLHNITDCAKFSMTLPAYYAYRRALPWMVSYVTATEGDVRTAPANIPVGQLNSFTSGSADAFFRDMVTGISSGNYRVEPNSTRSEWSDTCPVSIDKQFLIPGTMNYTDGHCLLLAQVDKYGELHFINASINRTRDIFTFNGMNTVAGIEPMTTEDPNPLKGCFQGLRVFRYPICETNGSGVVTKVRRRTDAEMEEFGASIEQYQKVTQVSTEHVILEDGLRLQSMHEFIRYRMKSVDKVVPLEFLHEYVKELAEMYQQRDTFVQDAWKNVKTGGLIAFPEEMKDDNIFQSVGRWEDWSSPSSDVDRRNKYFYLADWMDNAVRWYESAPQLVDLKGFEKYNIKSKEDFAEAIVEEKRKAFKEHFIEYVNTPGEKVKLSLADIEERIYDMSFDPNHAPEIRWGARPGTPEFATAKINPTPSSKGGTVPFELAYEKQAYYRTVCQRETEKSYLRNMFTAGYPVRVKFDQQLDKWLYGRYPERLAQATMTAGAKPTEPAANTAPATAQPAASAGATTR
ncbi:MAG: hypothetical protein IT367_02820 [Candidatus Hydrogenedentes bacterium]|nr:hypothetical protein [Candidatus Hydrogenedentota bacterium]